jgi:hypothetical protein
MGPSPAKTVISVCDRCPVTEICLWDAMVAEAGEEYRYGIRGGCTAARRRRIADSLPADADLGAAYRAALDLWAS